MQFFINRLKSQLACRLTGIRHGLPLKTMDAEESLAYLLENPVSLIRWGDGETVILMGGSIPFQKQEPKLRATLKKLLQAEHEQIAIGLPWQYLVSPITEGQGMAWKHSRFTIAMNFPMKRPCLDAFMFRHHSKQQQQRLDDRLVEKLWRRFPNVIIVSGTLEFLPLFRAEYPNCNFYIVETPGENAFSKLPEIYDKIDPIITEKKLNRENCCLLAACGPTAKVLVAKFANQLLCYDMGHYFAHRYGTKKNK